jgi:hypothetical protein
MRTRVFAAVAGLWLLLTPVAAEAQSCSALRSEMYNLAYRQGGLAAEYPGTHLAIMGCLIGYSNPNDREGCAGAVVLGARLFMTGYEWADLASRWAVARFSYYAISRRMRALGCRE